ncbi:unnamed protein product [Adineta steineri]|uniref:Uncharacterized protein n=1 Tax=Adineta steineri TaxID=433720 RepID=A0A815J5J3_9BILA|nr:unnamed protein product [Adineta steineri]
MGSGCCKKTQIYDAAVAVVQTQNVVATETPYGYVYIYPGAPTPHQTYTCPMLSIHTYYHSSQKTDVDYAMAQLSNKKKHNKQFDPVSKAKEEHLASDETVLMIPVEDVINIYYTSDVKKSVKAEEHSRRVPVIAQKGCCSCCKDDPEPQRETTIIEQKSAHRVITIHLQYSKYSNLDTVSNARILSEADRVQFFRDKFQPNTELKFYLVRNTEYDSTNFEQKRMQAENLCRIIMQLKGMNSGIPSNNLRIHMKDNVAVSAVPVISYPSPQELQQILNQPYYGIFGDSHQERSHSVQTQLDFGTHAPVPITTTVLGAIEMRSKGASAIKDDNKS